MSRRKPGRSPEYMASQTLYAEIADGLAEAGFARLNDQLVVELHRWYRAQYGPEWKARWNAWLDQLPPETDTSEHELYHSLRQHYLALGLDQEPADE